MIGARVQPLDERQGVSERGPLGKSFEIDAKAGAGAGFDLVTDVHLGRRIVSREHDPQTGPASVCPSKCGDLWLDLLLHPGGKRLPIEYPCAHAFSRRLCLFA